ncbi:alkaline phosphatase family protein [Stygiolobus caldivivus]|uniref:Nucleotide pyrophosphatase n=1 Tax=Stygiolobus caldivivus TaxID=2824673 RepID=A0A8D5U983_9CREN|nr:alkaline phosphatase family protein [Stygiolobus caldivivus]BCU71577.1 nucleotide pyrophosphatase [Stygiolobus caldivivus]
MNLHDLSREIKSVLKEDKKDVGNIVHKDRMSLILVDGLGWNIAQRLNTSVKPEKINSIFPSITVTVFATLLTAKRPGEHGILGWRIYDREEGRILNLMKVLKEQSVELDTFFSNTDSVFIMPEVATKSMMSKLKVIPYYTYWDGLYKYKLALENKDSKFVFFYLPYVDAMSHLYGPFSSPTLETASEVMGSLEKITNVYRESYSILITSDHGHVQVDRSVNLREDEEFLREMEFPPYGDARSLMFKSKRPLASLSKYGTLYEREKVEELVGGTNNIPDYLLVPFDNVNVVYWKDDMEHKYKGSHGGLTKDEMEIPLFVYE